MKGLRLYLIVLGILSALSAWFLLNRRSGTYKPSLIEFAVADTVHIASIGIVSPAGHVELYKKDGKWQVNGTAARKDAVKGLLILVSRIEVEAPVSGAIEERVLNGLLEESTSVRIAMKDGGEKSYRVYFDSLASSTFMMFAGSKAAFRVRVRGYRQDNFAGAYTGDARYWMDNIIFQANPADISRVTFLNNTEPQRSFHLARNESGEFEAAGGITPGSWSPANFESLHQYLSYFHEVRFERFRDPASDTLYRREEPDFQLKLELTGGELQSLELYPVYYPEAAGEKRLELNLLYGRLGSMEEWIVIKYVQIDPLLQDFEYFK
jgi:hypothetical protein